MGQLDMQLLAAGRALCIRPCQLFWHSHSYTQHLIIKMLFMHICIIGSLCRLLIGSLCAFSKVSGNMVIAMDANFGLVRKKSSGAYVSFMIPYMKEWPC